MLKRWKPRENVEIVAFAEVPRRRSGSRATLLGGLKRDLFSPKEAAAVVAEYMFLPKDELLQAALVALSSL